MQGAIGELRCPTCQDDITVCPCSPGSNRAMYNIARAFRTAEAQRLLPILRHRFGEETLREAALQVPSYAAARNLPEKQTRVLYDVDPPTHESAVVKSRTLCEAIASHMRRRGQLFADHPPALGRVQWSAVNIIGSYLTFDNVSKSMCLRRQTSLETETRGFSQRLLGPHVVSGVHNVLLSLIAA